MSSSEEEQEFELGENEEEEQVEDEEEEDDDESPRTRKRKSTVSYAEEDDDEEEEEEEADDDSDSDDDSDDDIPLAQLKSPKKTKAEPKKKVEKKAATPKKKVEKKSPASKKKKTSKESTTTSTTTTSSTRSSDDYNSLAGAIFGSECIKGQLIQKLLCRWWYAIDWPTNLPAKPPKHYDAMNGMPGVYVCTEGDDVGKIMDLRDGPSKPCFANFLKKDSDELKQLLMTAVEEQKRQLIKAEGEGTPTEKELKDMLKWVQKINGDKADKDAGRVLKKAGMAQQ